MKIENCIGLKIGVLSMKYIYSVIKFTKIYNLLDSKIKHFRWYWEAFDDFSFYFKQKSIIIKINILMLINCSKL